MIIPSQVDLAWEDLGLQRREEGEESKFAPWPATFLLLCLNLSGHWVQNNSQKKLFTGWLTWLLLRCLFHWCQLNVSSNFTSNDLRWNNILVQNQIYKVQGITAIQNYQRAKCFEWCAWECVSSAVCQSTRVTQTHRKLTQTDSDPETLRSCPRRWTSWPGSPVSTAPPADRLQTLTAERNQSTGTTLINSVIAFFRGNEGGARVWIVDVIKQRHAESGHRR